MGELLKHMYFHTRHAWRMGFVCSLLSVLLLGGCRTSSNTPSVITEFSLPSFSSQASAITTGPDGALWFTEPNVNKIGRITTQGTITEFSLPTANSQPDDITAGPDGALWFTEASVNQIGHITTTGMITEFTLPTYLTSFSEKGENNSIKAMTNNNHPTGIITGPDGALWFGVSVQATQVTANGIIQSAIGSITTQGKITEFAAPADPLNITLGSDGAFWFTAPSTGQVGRITIRGNANVPDSFGEIEPKGITSGPDGTLWVTVPSDGVYESEIIRITPQGKSTLFALASTNDVGSGPSGITTGPDGALWFTMGGSDNKIGRITPQGSSIEYTLPTANSNPTGITTGPDGALWFTETKANKIGRLSIPAHATSP